MCKDWTQVSRNPVSKEAHDFLQENLKRIRIKNAHDFMPFLKLFVEGHDVLDIGIVEHDISHIESENWKHGYICNWAKTVLGIDILSDEVKLLKQRGFNVVEVDATSNIDLGKRFDRIVVGDVIEHVNNPVKLLKFAGRHISDSGLIFVSTPNPYFYRFIYRTIVEGTFIANTEHISWITPSMALELGRRSGLVLKEYCLVQGEPKSRVKKMIKDLIAKKTEFFTPAFIYIYEKK